VRIGEQVVQHVRVEYVPGLELLAEFVALDGAAILLLCEVKRDLGGVPLQLAALDVLFHAPALGQERIGVAVNDVPLGYDFGAAVNQVQNPGPVIELAEKRHVVRREELGLQPLHQLVGLTF